MSFWPILEHSVYASVLIALVWFLKWLFGEHMSARWHLFLWLLVCVRLVLPLSFSIRSEVSLWNTVDIEQAKQTAAMAADHVAWQADGGTEVLPVVSNLVEPAKSYRAAPAEDIDLSRAGKILFYVWAVGAGGLFGFYVLSAVWLHIRALRLPKADNVLLLRLDRLWQQYELPGEPPRCVIAPDGESPYVCGLGMPVLVLPAAQAETVDDRVLLHEFCHVARLDIAKNWLLTIVRCTQWFNPLFWLACDRAADDLELCCDEKVLSLLKDEHERLGYGHVLLDLVMRRFRYRAGTSCIANREGNIRRRIRRIARRRELSGRAKGVGVLIWVLVLICTVTGPQYAAAERWMSGQPLSHVGAALWQARLHRVSGPSEAAYLYGKAYALDCGYYLWQVTDADGRAALETQFAENQAAGVSAVWRFDDTITQNYWYDFLRDDGVTQPDDTVFAEYAPRTAGFGIYDLMGGGDRYTAVIGYPVAQYSVMAGKDEETGEIRFVEHGRYYWDEIEIIKADGRWQVRQLERHLSERDQTEAIAWYGASRIATYRAEDARYVYEIPVNYVQAYRFYGYDKVSGTWQDAPSSIMSLFGWSQNDFLLPGGAETGYVATLRCRPKSGVMMPDDEIEIVGDDAALTMSWGTVEGLVLRNRFHGNGSGGMQDFEMVQSPVDLEMVGQAAEDGFYDVLRLDSWGGGSQYEQAVRALPERLNITVRSSMDDTEVQYFMLDGYGGEEAAS